MMKSRPIGPFSSSVIGLGCMNLSHAYGTPPDADYAARLLNEALDSGYTHLDTAWLYGGGKNETLIGNTLKSRRGEFMLASKCGMGPNAEGVREINGRPEIIKSTCEAALKRLQTEVIDLYYLHRWDKSIPIEESVGAMADLVKEGKIRGIGLSEVSADTLRKAHAEHPIMAVQSEYSLWSRNPEIAVLDACKELGATFVAFSPVARAYLTGVLQDVSNFEAKDIRRGMPRFNEENYPKNLALLEQVKPLAENEGCSLAQLALAWLLQQGEHIVAIPGTTSIEHMKENGSAADVTLSDATLQALDEIFRPEAIAGDRYNPPTQAEIDTENFA